MLVLLLLSASQAPTTIPLRLESPVALSRFTPGQIAILEKLNRADVRHLGRLKALIVPDVWTDELAYSPLPQSLDWAAPLGKHLLVHLPAQVFGAYEHGKLVRWGPVSSGRARHPTPSGLFHLNWRARKRFSTDDPAWILEWYFNFHNGRGLAFHEFALPGPWEAGESCVHSPAQAGCLLDLQLGRRLGDKRRRERNPAIRHSGAGHWSV